MQRLKRTIKRMAAIGTGVAFLGATLTGAVAQDLADYPQPYVDVDGVYNDDTAIVVGENAAASDTLGAVDIATQLQFDAKTPVTGGVGTLTVAGGVTEDIPLGQAIANDTAFGLDSELDDGDVESFLDSEISFASDKFNVHDVLLLTKTSPTIETSLTSSDDDYESNIFLESVSGAIQYYMVFDETIQPNKSTSSDPLELKFLGKTLKITAIDDTGINNKFTATVGAEFFMDVGDTVTVDGKVITLVNVGEGGTIIVDVDGVQDTISASGTQTVNGIEIKNEDTFYTNELSERVASLIIGEDAVKTYVDGEEYVGEDEDDPDWVWNVGNLNSKGATSNLNASADPQGPFVGIKSDFTKNDDTDDPAGLGECYDLPNNYASICFDSLTVSDDDYLTVTLEYASGVDTAKSKHPRGTTSSNVLHVYAPGDDRFILKTAGWTEINGSVNDKKTSEIWIQGPGIVNGLGQNETMIFYKDSDQTPSTVYAGNVTTGGSDDGAASNITQILELNYEDSKQSNAVLTITNLGITPEDVQLRWNFTGDSSSELETGQDVILTNWSMSSGEFTSLGSTLSQEEVDEVIWEVQNRGDWGGSSQLVTLGTKDEDHRGPYGYILKDPKSNGASDQVVLQIPGDHVQANVVVKGATTTVSGGAVTYIPADIDVNTRLDSEVTGSESDFNLILVGGPCINNAVEAVSELGVTCAGWTLAPGEAMLKFASNGDNVALLVAGTNALDTRMASSVLGNYVDYTLAGDMATVTGSLSSPVVA